MGLIFLGLLLFRPSFSLCLHEKFSGGVSVVSPLTRVMDGPSDPFFVRSQEKAEKEEATSSDLLAHLIT